MTDHYRQRLAHAKWTWREDRHHKGGRRDRFKKDRPSGRAERRSARQADYRELAADVQAAVMDAPAERFPCDCGDPDCARAAYLASLPAR